MRANFLRRDIFLCTFKDFLWKHKSDLREMGKGFFGNVWNPYIVPRQTCDLLPLVPDEQDGILKGSPITVILNWSYKHHK